MDPITLIGIIGSVASVISLFKQDGRTITVDGVANQVIIDSRRTTNQGATQSQTDILSQVSAEELLATTAAIIGIYNTDADFLKRIEERCLAKHRAAIKDNELPETEFDEVYQETRFCVCRNIAFARREAHGKFPSEDFKYLFEKFNCATMI